MLVTPIIDRSLSLYITPELTCRSPAENFSKVGTSRASELFSSWIFDVYIPECGIIASTFKVGEVKLSTFDVELLD